MGYVQKGFTLVELLVVIAVIAVLATISTLGINKFLVDGRDSNRATSATVIAEALEKYYDGKGEYPGCSILTANASTVSQSVLTGIDESVLLTPRASGGATNSVSCSDEPSSIADVFQYRGDGSVTCSSGSSCLSYTLRYREDATDQILELNSRRTAPLATSGAPTLNASATGLTSLATNWNQVLNATGYQLQASTSATFSSLAYDQNLLALSQNLSGLNYGTSYFLRVRAILGADRGTWSPVVNVSTRTLSAPTLAASATSTTALSTSWNAVTSATGYQLQASTSSSFGSFAYNQNVTGTSQAISGLGYNTGYFVRIRAVSGANQGPWSNVVNVSTRALAAPTITATANSASQVSTSWTAVTGATGYSVQWSTNQSSWSTSTVTTTSRAVTGLNEGTLYYFRVRAEMDGNLGPWSAVDTATTNPGAPTGITMSAAMSGNSAVGTTSASCASGTLQFQIRNRSTDTSTAGTWSAWTTWSTATTNTVSSTAQGTQYGFQSQARCLVGSVSSALSAGSNVATTVRGFAAPGAPSVGVSTSGDNTTFTRTSTPTCAGNGTQEYQYRRNSDNGATYSFALVTSTTVVTGTSSQGFQYGIEWQARCRNVHNVGPWGPSGTNSYIRPVAPASPQTFNGYRGAWDIMYLTVSSSCGPGAILYGAVDVHTWDWGWTPGNHLGWRRSSLGWTNPPDSYWANTMTTGSQSSRGIPSGSRWNVGSEYKCQNSITGRNSGNKIWRESGIFTAS